MTGRIKGMKGMKGMQILERIDDSDEDIIKVRFRGSSSMVNAIRRTIYTSIPILAVDEVIIHSNQTIHHDQYLADRIKLVTMRCVELTPEVYEFEYTSNPALNKQNYSITAGMIFGKKAVNSNTVIVKVKNTENLRITVKTAVETGKVHSKYYPVSSVAYHLVEGTENNGIYDLTIESMRAIPADVILSRALDTIEGKLLAFKNAVKGNDEKKNILESQ